jgi:hypothetical protein
MTRLVIAMGLLLELYMWTRQPFTRASDLDMVSYAMQRIGKAEAPLCKIIETYWNTAMQQSNIQSVAFEARTREITKEVC